MDDMLLEKCSGGLNSTTTGAVCDNLSSQNLFYSLPGTNDTTEHGAVQAHSLMAIWELIIHRQASPEIISISIILMQLMHPVRWLMIQ
ncbi:MAG: hypothetical protein IPL74_08160 [Bacteroidetes bacterium]|nr:hypothetical protein [Bacteroidota bacterium]